MKLVQLFLKKGLATIAPVLKLAEKVLIKRYAKKGEHQPIFIVGAPRTGSTALYQAITELYEVTYFDNLMDYLNKNPFFGSVLSRWFFGNSGHSSFKSDLGHTFDSGLHAPSECGAFWYRWLPRNRHYVTAEQVSENDKKELKSEILAISNFQNKPLVFKNLNAGQRLSLLHEIFPDSKIIFIKRDVFYTTQSIVKAKKKLGIPLDQFWSIMPKNVEELKKLPWAKQIVGQVFFLEKQIEKDILLFNKKMTINYEDLISNTDKVLNDVGDFIFDGRPKKRKNATTPIIEGLNKKDLETTLAQKIEEEIIFYYDK